MDKLIKKLKKLLSKNGVDESKIESIVSELEDTDEEDKDVDVEIDVDTDKEEDTPAEDVAPVEESEPVADPEPVEEPSGEGEPAPAVEPEPVNETPVDPVPETEAPVNPDGSVDVDPSAIGEEPVPEAPVEEPAPAPVAEPSEIEELRTALADKDRVIEGLTARVDALETALKDAGVIKEGSDKSEPIGSDTPILPGNVSTDDPMEDVLREINSNR